MTAINSFLFASKKNARFQRYQLIGHDLTYHRYIVAPCDENWSRTTLQGGAEATIVGPRSNHIVVLGTSTPSKEEFDNLCMEATLFFKTNKVDPTGKLLKYLQDANVPVLLEQGVLNASRKQLAAQESKLKKEQEEKDRMAKEKLQQAEKKRVEEEKKKEEERKRMIEEKNKRAAEAELKKAKEKEERQKRMDELKKKQEEADQKAKEVTEGSAPPDDEQLKMLSNLSPDALKTLLANMNK